MVRRLHVTEAVRQEARSTGRAVRLAWTGPGRERDLALLSLKAALAGLIAWMIAGLLLQAPLPFIAPWVVVVLVRSTVYQSVAQALQQLGAIAGGTVLATADGATLGSATAAMAVVLPVTLLLGNWPRLGDQGIYGATAALFVLTSGDMSVDAATARLLESLLGAAVGVGVNMLVLPPVHLRSTRTAVRAVIDEASQTLTAVAEGLSGSWGHREARDWDERARRLFSLIGQARSALDRGRESTWLNPDRRNRAELRRRHGSFTHTVHVLEQLSDYLSDLTRTLVEASDDRTGRPRPEEGVTALYTRFLHDVAAAVETYGELVTGDDRSARLRLRRAVDEVHAAQRRLRELLATKGTGGPEWLALYGSLLVDARRVAEQLLEEPPGDTS
ncbi:FUSC family protein [Streptomyces sp. 5K101]|uniref:FUSC family protein n=1 Tax=Streptomyces sp. 5K101 TaxID=3390037 RepID=UPI003975FA53